MNTIDKNCISKKEYKVSVIIPCYNQENNIEDCLNSIAKQKFEGLEVIIVDDGSTDLTKNKIEEYKANNNKLDIFYFYQNNAGPGIARNTGLSHARGKYIAFLDSDDKLPAGAYNALYYTAEKNNSDLVIGEYLRRVDNGNWYILDYIKNYCKENEGKNCAGDYIVAIRNPSLWNRLYRKEFLLENNIKFLPEVHGEDLVFNFDVVKFAKSIYTTQSVVYCYNKQASTKSTLSTSWNLKNSSSWIRSLKTYATYFDKIGDVYAELIYLETQMHYFLSGLSSINDTALQNELFEQFKEILNLYKGNQKYEKYWESILGVKFNIVLEVPYNAYRKFLYLNNFNNNNSNTITKTISVDLAKQTLQAFANGQIGLRYILLYFKAWLKVKLKRLKWKLKKRK